MAASASAARKRAPTGPKASAPGNEDKADATAARSAACAELATPKVRIASVSANMRLGRPRRRFGSTRVGACCVLDHPLAAARLTTLRDERTDNAAFRAALRDLTLMLVYEATRDAACETVAVRTPLAETTGCRLANPPLLVPVLRAGLGMVDQAHALIPEARVGFVGVARDEETHEPTPYLESLPDDLSTQPVMVLDPMLATGGSMAHTIGLLHSRNAVDITAVCVVCAPEGIAALEKVAPNVRLVTATIDERLNDIAYIVPGLGDAGDRQFGPR